jgi:hypothetical protein
MRTSLQQTITATAIIAAATLAGPASVSAHGSLPKGKYSCYVFYQPGVPTYTGRYLSITGSTTYRWFDSKASKSGTYRHSAGGAITFKTGPLKGKAGMHRTYGNGSSDVSIKMAAGANSNYSCATSN